MKTYLNTILLSVVGILISTFAVSAQVASGSPYTLQQSMIALGIGQSSGSTFAVAGIIGQSFAGQTASGSSFTLNAVSRNPTSFSPTAGGMTLGGRVTTAKGEGIRNVRVTLAAANGATRETVTGAGGLYTFDDVSVGETYVVSVFAKRYRFTQNTQILSLTEDVSNIDFVAEDIFGSPQTPILTDRNK